MRWYRDPDLLQIAVAAVVSVLTALTLLLLLAIFLRPAAVHAAGSPSLVLLEGEAFVALPGGGLVYLPAGASIEACAPRMPVAGNLPAGSPPPVLVHDAVGRMLRVPSPCTGIFASGFEVAP